MVQIATRTIDPLVSGSYRATDRSGGNGTADKIPSAVFGGRQRVHVGRNRSRILFHFHRRRAENPFGPRGPSQVGGMATDSMVAVYRKCAMLFGGRRNGKHDRRPLVI